MTDSVVVSKRRRWALALAATFTMTISYVDRQTLSVLAPRVTADLGIDEKGFGRLLAAFSVAYLLGAPLAGGWIDRIGARRGLLMAVIVWTSIAGLHMVAPSFGVLLAMRVALGFAESPSFPGAAQTVQRALPIEDRARAFGVLFTGSSIGAMIAPPLATMLMAMYSWRVAFLGTAIAGLVWVPIWLTVAWSRDGRALLDRGPAPVVFSEHAEGDTATPPFRGAAKVVGEKVSPMWRHPAMQRAIVLIVSAAPAISFVLLWSSKFLVKTYRMRPEAVALYLLVPTLVYDLGSVAFGDLSSRRARRRGFDGSPDRALIGVAAVMASCVGLLSVAPTAVIATAVACVAMAGGGGLYAMLTNDLMSRVPEGSVSAAGGLCASAQSVAYIAASLLIGMVAQADGNYSRAVIALGMCVLPGAAVWIVWKPPPARGVARA